MIKQKVTPYQKWENMAYDDRFKARVKAEYEAGVDKKSDICKRYKIPRKTLNEWAVKAKWEWQKSNTEVLEKVTKSTTRKLELEFGDRLEDFTTEHLEAMGEVADLTRKSLERLRGAVDEKGLDGKDNRMTRDEAEAIFSQQKVLKISSETLSIVYADKRKALGLDKEKNDNDKNADAIEARITLLMEEHGIE